MLMTNFSVKGRYSKGKADPISYVLSDKDHTGQLRSVKPEIIGGSLEALRLSLDGNQRKNKYTSGVLAFRDSEQPTPEQVQWVCQQFLDTFMPGQAQEHVPHLFVQHRDKGNIEIHYVVAREWIREDGRTKAFNVAPTGKKYLQMKDDFVALANHALGYAQIKADPFATYLSQFDRLPKQAEHTQRKTNIAKSIKGLILKGQIANREQLIEFLQDNGTVTRTGANFISFKMAGTNKAIRFKGEMFKEGADYAQLRQAYKAFKQNQGAPLYLSPEQVQQRQQRLAAATEQSRTYFEKTYLPTEKLGRLKKAAPATEQQQPTTQAPTARPPQVTAPQPTTQPISTTEPEAVTKSPPPIIIANASRVHSNSFRAMTGLPPALNMASKAAQLSMSIGHANLQLLSLIAQKSSLNWFKLSDLQAANELDRLIFQLRQQIQAMEAEREQAAWSEMVAPFTSKNNKCCMPI